MDDVNERAAMVQRAAAAGAAVAAEGFRADLAVETKHGKTDVVTQADRDAQRRVVEVIGEEYPDEVIVGEEGDELKTVPDDGPAWVVDPIDGTNNFVDDIPYWATSVAAVVDGEPVAAANVMPELGDTYVSGPDGVTLNGDPIAVSEATDPETFSVAPTMWWPRDRRDEYGAVLQGIVDRFDDLRRFGSAQSTLSMVAAGMLEGAVTNVETNPWDTIAGVHMVRKGGGTVTDVHGDRWRHDSVGLVASNDAAHDEVLAACREALEP